MTNTDWAGTRERLAGLSARPGAGEVFGASGHGWELRPPLSDGELAEAEAQLGLSLPGEYRDFLLQVSRGGAGPSYGLFPLHRVDGRWRWEGDGADLTEIATLARPFPYRDAFNPAAGLPDPPDDEDYDTVEAFDAASDAYQELHDAVAYAPEHSVGLVYLCHLGCAAREALVVSGPSRGEMWADDTADDEGFRPLLTPDGGRVGFAAWYHGWLARAEQKVC